MAKKVQNLTKTLDRILFFGGATWVLIFALTNTVLNPPQCPASYTQAQVDASNCIIGANISLGLLYLFVILPLAATLVTLFVARLILGIKKV